MQTTLTPAGIYNAIFAGQTVTIRMDLADFKRLRVAIAKRHITPKALELTNESVRASYLDGTASFWLGPRQTTTRVFSVTIEDRNETLRDNLGQVEES